MAASLAVGGALRIMPEEFVGKLLSDLWWILFIVAAMLFFFSFILTKPYESEEDKQIKEVRRQVREAVEQQFREYGQRVRFVGLRKWLRRVKRNLSP
jgi:hypothetical protein